MCDITMVHDLYDLVIKVDQLWLLSVVKTVIMVIVYDNVSYCTVYRLTGYDRLLGFAQLASLK